MVELDELKSGDIIYIEKAFVWGIFVAWVDRKAWVNKSNIENYKFAKVLCYSRLARKIVIRYFTQSEIKREKDV